MLLLNNYPASCLTNNTNKILSMCGLIYGKLKIDGKSIHDRPVEDKLLGISKSDLMGDSIPNEIELSSALGVARSVLRKLLAV